MKTIHPALDWGRTSLEMGHAHINENQSWVWGNQVSSSSLSQRKWPSYDRRDHSSIKAIVVFYLHHWLVHLLWVTRLLPIGKSAKKFLLTTHDINRQPNLSRISYLQFWKPKYSEYQTTFCFLMTVTNFLKFWWNIHNEIYHFNHF